MGSLGSRPKVPSYPQQVVYYVPQPTYTPPADTGGSGGGGGSDPSTADPAATAAKAREQNLLQRSRGLFGTVQTGFRGFLSIIESGTRKSLLGE